ncbi:MAG: hypothetical protein ACTHK8_19105 [Ginsengibacter sp.]
MKKIIVIFLCLLALKSQAQYPAGSILLYNFDMADANAVAAINGADTTMFYPETNTTYGQFTDASGHTYGLQRNYGGGLHLSGDTALISTIKDGMPDNGDGYGRSEVTLYGYIFTIDTNHIYTLEWKGYLPQDTNYLTSYYQILLAMQIHSGTQTPTVWGLNLDAAGNIFSGDVYDDYSGVDYGKGPGLKTVNDTIGSVSGWYNSPHTVRLTLREGKGYPGQTAFMHIQVDGVTLYRRDSGQVGSSTWDDYVKFGGLYDYYNPNGMVDINNYTRGRRFSLVTDSYKVYQVPSDLADDPSTPSPFHGPYGLNCKCNFIEAKKN